MNGYIKLCIVTVPGFKNTEVELSGMRILNREIRRMFAGPEVLVLHRAWNSSARDTAWLIHQDCTPECPIVTIHHSYGGGVFLPRVARALEHFHRHIDVSVLVDPVRRFWGTVLLPWRAWRHVLHGTDKLRLPPNVKKAHVFWQVNDYPRGRDVVANPDVHITRRVYGTPVRLEKYAAHVFDTQRIVSPPRFGHSEIDNDLTIHRDVLKIISDVVSVRVGVRA